MNLYCPSNAPIACKMDLFENDQKYMGSKTFFMRIQYDDDAYTLPTSTTTQQQAWLDRQEIVDHMKTIQGNDGASKFYHYML